MQKNKNCQTCDCNDCKKNINRPYWDSASGACDGCSYCSEIPDGKCIFSNNNNQQFLNLKRKEKKLYS